MRRLPRVLVVASLLLALTSSAVARADDESLDAASEARFKEGVSYAKQGKYEQARGSFLQTLALSPGSPKVLLNLAISEHGSGHYVEALAHLKAYLANPKIDPKKAAEIKQTLYDDLSRATGHLRITADRGEALVLDGDTKLGNAPLADTVDVAAGDHRVAAGSRVQAIRVAAGETKDVVFVGAITAPAAAVEPLSTPSAPSAPPASSAPRGDAPAPAPEERPAPVWKPLTFVLGGATLLAAGAAFYFNVKSRDDADRASSLRAEHAGSDCSGASPPSFCADIKSATSSEDGAATASTVLWVGAGVLLAATAGSGVLWATSSSRAAVAPVAGPRTAGASFRLDF